MIDFLCIYVLTCLSGFFVKEKNLLHLGSPKNNSSSKSKTQNLWSTNMNKEIKGLDPYQKLNPNT